MGGSKGNRKSKPKGKAKAKRAHAKKQKIDAKMLAIALIFIMLFVSYVVIFSSQPPSSKNMVFYEINEKYGIWHGNVRNINVSLSDVRLKIWDSSSDSTNSTDVLENVTVLNTEGNFNCIFYDVNNNSRLDKEDRFRVFNATAGDRVELRLKSSGKELAYYTF